MVSDDVMKTLDKANMQLAGGEYQKSFNTLKKLVKEEGDIAEAYFGMAEASMGLPKLSIQISGSIPLHGNTSPYGSTKKF